MGVILYNIFLWLFRAATYVASLFNTKAKKWVAGRKNIYKKLEAAIPSSEKIIWMHCASLGEFEQGRPLIEQLKTRYPEYRILLSFFSPSGYEIQKNYKYADWVFYLPLDGPRNAKRFLEIVNPSLVIFVKYEFWYYYLKKIRYRNIPLILVSALFREDMSFFKWYGAMQRKILSRFNQLFVQNQASKELLVSIGLAGISKVSGDTRFDRVIEIASAAKPLPLIEGFIRGHKTIIAGSTWKNDEELLATTHDFLAAENIKLIIAPHEINPEHIEAIQVLFPHSIAYSKLAASATDFNSNVLIIDNIGMLSTLYKYAWCSYVGGGLSRTGVHNVAEAAVYEKPVCFGPNYEKYREATELVALQGAFVVNNSNELQAILRQFLTNTSSHEEAGKKAGNYIKENGGAVKIIMDYIQENRLLTN